MVKFFFWLVILNSVLFISCKKDTIDLPEPPQEPLPATNYKISFIFVNKIGFRNDSTTHGNNDTVFQGPCLDSKYYDKSSNMTHLDNTCYNRNYALNNFPTTDSIIFRVFESEVGDKFGFQVEMVWKRPVFPYTTKVLRYATLNFNNGDTIKIAKDTIVKFIWPTDTNSGRFIKTYQWP